MMNHSNNFKDFAARLLRARLDGKLRNPSDVLEISRECQPASGFSNGEWNDITAFILKLKPADNIPAAKKLADEYSLTLEY